MAYLKGTFDNQVTTFKDANATFKEVSSDQLATLRGVVKDMQEASERKTDRLLETLLQVIQAPAPPVTPLRQDRKGRAAATDATLFQVDDIVRFVAGKKYMNKLGKIKNITEMSYMVTVADKEGTY